MMLKHSINFSSPQYPKEYKEYSDNEAGGHINIDC